MSSSVIAEEFGIESIHDRGDGRYVDHSEASVAKTRSSEQGTLYKKPFWSLA